MTTRRCSGPFVRLVAVTVAWASFVAGWPAATASQRDGPSLDTRVQEPTELLREYPLGQRRLGRGDEERPSAAQSPPPDRQPAERDGSLPGLLPFLVAAAAVIGLLVLALLKRRRTRAFDEPARRAVDPSRAMAEWKRSRGPRQRREVRPATLTLLRPLLSYSYSRDAYVLRGIGQYWGPVLRQRPPPLSSLRSARFRPEPRKLNSYAVVSQRRGVGKTTITLVLGAALARQGRRVLVVDLDPQASATKVLRAGGDGCPTIADVLLEPAMWSLADAVVTTGWGIDLVPSDAALMSADATMVTAEAPVLLRQLDSVSEYELVLIDCPPSLGTLTLDALTSTSRTLVVIEPSYLAMQSMIDLLEIVSRVRAVRNPQLEVAGIVLNRLKTSAEHRRSVAQLEGAFGDYIWRPHIPEQEVLQEAMRKGLPPQELRTPFASEVTSLFDPLVDRLEDSRLATSGPARRG